LERRPSTNREERKQLPSLIPREGGVAGRDPYIFLRSLKEKGKRGGDLLEKKEKKVKDRKGASAVDSGGGKKGRSHYWQDRRGRPSKGEGLRYRFVRSRRKKGKKKGCPLRFT